MALGRVWGRRPAAAVGVAYCLLTAGSWAQGTVAAPEKAPTTMSKEQVKDLFNSVDDILSFASTDTKLPVLHKVKRTLVSRDQVIHYLTKKFSEDESAKRLENSEIVLKKFGLLDHDFHLQPFMLSLLTEQVAGFYDEKTKTVNLLDYVAADEQKPVLAHELTHALQDQKVGLEKWSASPVQGSKNVGEDNRRLQVDELETARQAVTEGQAMVVFIDYTLRTSGKTLADMPEMGAKMRDMAADTSGSPVMARAPLLLQRSLTFPYSDGLNFEQQLLLKGGKDMAFAGALDRPPGSSFEIIHPSAYIAKVPVPVLPLPDVHGLLDADWAPYDMGVMGELDVQIMTELFGGRQMAVALSPQWAGGIYYAAQKRSASAEEKLKTSSIGLMYFSKWKEPDSARSFLHVYGSELARKYGHVVRRPKDEKSDDIGDDEEVYTTDEGDVLLSITGATVFVSEGFPLATARRLRDSVQAVQPTGRVQSVQLDAPTLHDPALGLVRSFASYGVMKVATHVP
ncbi:hypothetical protein SAMN05421770_10513 [Granulicella rosea]|uniref:DUF4157 domain-containing protein n=1 Tax=Granulicella rosea TaxID=474952 RepID=A0A239KJ90_9BACT|nr:hypothetical protein [Granulicella rosea]SNT18447.1 hypothetical protein SAMN05421770_10513 [Granulicella rosea]